MSYTAVETKENRQKWVTALRSGKYEQTINQLANIDRTAFCCLGIACEISGLGKWETGSVNSIYSTESDSRTDRHTTTLPQAVQEWLGLRDKYGALAIYDGRCSLANVNDKGATFAEIADIIESEPKGLLA